jgi:hypothetical protein
MLQIRSAGGAVNEVPADATACAHRHQNFSVTAVSVGDWGCFDRTRELVHQLMDGDFDVSGQARHRCTVTTSCACAGSGAGNEGCHLTDKVFEVA